MNAAEQAKGLELATKIAAVVTLFKAAFPDARVDLKPWANDANTQEWVDPDSIDIAFHFPGWSRLFQSRSILVQIRFFEDPLTGDRRVIGLEVAGFTQLLGEQWRLSTIENWEFVGETQPKDTIKDSLRKFCRQVFEVFSGESMKGGQ